MLKMIGKIVSHLKLKFTLLIFLGFLLYGNPLKAQKLDSIGSMIESLGNFLLYSNHDTTYISNFGNKIGVHLLAMNKFNFFQVSDRQNHTKIRYRPLRDVYLGLGVSYKWFSLSFSFSLGLNSNEDFDNTKSFDFQGTIFSSRQFISGTLQYYQGFELTKTDGINFDLPDVDKKREDIRTINFNLNYMNALNYKRFSLKAPFVFSEIQRKSAGSPIISVSFSIYIMDADSSVIPPDFNPYFHPKTQISDVNILSLAIGFGYMYSFVLKGHYFLTLGIIPGININAGDYFTEDRLTIPINVNFRLNTLNAIGYNGDKIYGGLQISADTYYSRLAKKFIYQVGFGKFTFFIGYRFGKK